MTYRHELRLSVASKFRPGIDPLALDGAGADPEVQLFTADTPKAGTGQHPVQVAAKAAITVLVGAAGMCSTGQRSSAECAWMARLSEGRGRTSPQRRAVPGTPMRPLRLQMAAEAGRLVGASGAANTAAGRGFDLRGYGCV